MANRNDVYTGSTLDLSNTTAQPTDSVVCTATATNSAGVTVTESNTVTIENRGPL